jgi:hypothetical protein
MNSRRFFSTAVCALLVYSMGSVVVLGQIDLTTERTPVESSGELRPALSETTGEQSLAGNGDGDRLPMRGPRWTASADFIILDRVGSFDQTLVETINGTVSVKDLANTPGTPVFNATDLHQGFCGGPRLGLIHHGDDGRDFEVSYFQIGDWNAYRSAGPTPNDWLVMKAPGDFVQEQDNKNEQMMAWDYASRLYNAEVNLRWHPWQRVSLLAGFRWVNLTEELQGTLPPERTTPFWDTQTKNNLYGIQIGAEGKVFECGRFSIGCMGKAGLFVNHVEETTDVSIYRILYGESAWTNHPAFVGETGLRCQYQVTRRLSLRAGYEAMWLQGVALAPAQIAETYSHQAVLPQDIYVQALGINCRSGVFYHGATVGLEYSF